MTSARGARLRLARQGGVYAVGNVLLKASGLLIVPLYLNLLTQEAYGYLGLLTATALIAIPVAGLGLTTGLLKFTAAPASEAERRAIPFTTLVTSAAAAALALGAFWLAAEPLARLLLDDPARAGLVRLLGAYVAVKVLGATPLMLMRAGERAGLYVAATVLETVLLIGGTYYFMAVRGLGLEGAVWALVLSAGISTAVLTAGTLARVAWRVDAALVGRLVRFGAPLVLGALALPVIHVGDRYVLKWLAGTEEVAVYDLAARLGGVLNMLVVQSFQQAFAVVGLKELGRGDAGRDFYRSTFRHYVVGMGWAALGLALVTYDAIALISTDPSYLRADAMVFPLCIGFLAYGLYIVFANVLIAAERTRLIGAILVLAVVVNLGLNAVLIPRWGGVGAALATLAAYGVMAGVAARAAERTRPVRYPWRALASTLLIVVGLWALGQVALEWGVAARLAWRAGLLALYPALVVAAGLYRPAEVRHHLGVLYGLLRREHGG